MKKIFSFMIIAVMAITFASAQTGAKKNNPVGSWKFDAPYAPEGYTSGTIVLGLTDQKYNASISFTGSEYKIPGENVKVEGDTVNFSVYLEGQEIKINLKMTDENNMTGKSVYSEGEIPLTLKKAAAATGK